MATKLNVGIDEELVRQMISGQTPPSTNVIRKPVSDPPASVVAISEDSSNPDSQPSETVVSERQDVKPESAPVPDIRRRLQKNISCPGGLRPPRLALCQRPYETENP